VIAHGKDHEIARLRTRVAQLQDECADWEREMSCLSRELDMEREHSRSMARVVSRLEAQMSEFVVDAS
jgi:chromosome segregation ATPase